MEGGIQKLYVADTCKGACC